MSMFGVLCSGRPVMTELQQVDVNRFMLTIPNASNIHHVGVFLLPGVTLDPSYVASVYFQLPGKDFELLGVISSAKPSALFKISNNQPTVPPGGLPYPDFSIVLGISIEPAEVQQALELKKANTSNNFTAGELAKMNPQGTAELANKIIQHAYNYLSGFEDISGKVSLKHFNDWWEKFKNRISVDPKFLDRVD